LPSDVSIVVSYGGSELESYSLAKGGPSNYVCCRAGSAVKGALPDVKCGLSVTDASMAPVTKHDASSGHDAALPHDASVMRDARATIARVDAASPNDAALAIVDARTFPVDAAESRLDDATAPFPLDASVVDAAPTGKPTASGSGTTAILCDLWTNGPTYVTVAGAGYVTTTTPFNAFVPDPRCGVQTLDERIVLVHGDAGL